MHTYILQREQIVPLSRPDTFAFFADAHNLERLTPPFLKFRILTPRPIPMAAGTVIEYRLSLYGIPFKWRTLIEAWTPDTGFVDRQLRGPYALWHHTHEFEDVGPGRTRVRDTVRYRIGFGPLGRLAHGLLVEHSLKRIFDYRAEATAQLLGADPETAGTALGMIAAAGD